MFDGIVDAINDFVRTLLYSPLSVALKWLEDIIDIVLHEVAQFDFINLPFITDCFDLCVTAALIILPLKLVIEWIWMLVNNDTEKWTTKVFAVFQIILVILLTPPTLDITSTTLNTINESILGGDIGGDASSTTSINTGKQFSATILIATTSLSEDEAKDFIQKYDTSAFDINERDEDDDYIYDFDFLMPLIACLGMWALIFFAGLQIAVRLVSIGFFKIITPLSALSLTHKENPTAFIVWRNSLIGSYLLNTVQLFLFVYMFKLISQISDATATAKLLFSIALIMAIIFIPNKVSAMIGGYSSGIMESMQSIQSMLMSGNAISSIAHRTGHAISGGAKTIGKATKGAYNTAKNLPHNTSSGIGKALSKGQFAMDGAKNKYANLKDFAKNMDSGLRNYGSDAVRTISEKGFKEGGKEVGKQTMASVGGAVGGVMSKYGNNIKDSIMHEKRAADMEKVFSDTNPLNVTPRSTLPKNENFHSATEGGNSSFQNSSSSNSTTPNNQDSFKRANVGGNYNNQTKNNNLFK